MADMNTLQAQFDRYLDHKARAGASANTLRAYRYDFAGVARLLAATTNTSPDQLTCHAIALSRLRNAFRTYARQHSPASTYRCWSTWTNLCEYLAANDVTASNPMSRLRRPPFPSLTPHGFDRDDITKLITTLTRPDDANGHSWQQRDLALVTLTLVTGCILSELVALNIGDFRDIDDNTGAKTFVIHGRGRRNRVLTAEAGLVAILTAYLTSRIERNLATAHSTGRVGIPWKRFDPGAPMFVGVEGDRITGGTIQHRVARAYRRAGIDGRRAPGTLVQQLRHTFALHLARTGIDLSTLQVLLGHECSRPAQQYAHLAGSEPLPLYHPPFVAETQHVVHWRLTSEASGTAALTPYAWPQRDLALIATMLVTGLRPAEACAARIGDLTGTPRHRTIEIHSDRKPDRTIPIGPPLEAILATYLAERAAKDPDSSTDQGAGHSTPRFALTEPLFAGRDGGPLTRSALRWLITSAYRRAGIDGQIPRGVALLALRETFANHLSEQGATDSEIAELLGYSGFQSVRY